MSLRRLVLLSSTILIACILLACPCVASGQKAHTRRETIKSSGKARSYVLHLPRGFKDKKKRRALVLMLHGTGGSGKIAASAYYGSWKNLADKEGFIVVFPDALGKPTRWKSWGGEQTEDTRFLAALIDHMLKNFPVDPRRVFMTGHSSGAYMSYAFAAVHADKVAAIGPVAGLYGGSKAPAVPVSVISFHGIKDGIVGYESDLTSKAQFTGSRGARGSAAFFARANGCARVRKSTMLKEHVLVDTWPRGRRKTEVVLYSIKGWGHGWPRRSTRTPEATALIWKFFKSHPRRGKTASFRAGKVGGK